ncbi:MAG TPA: hypothetical protein VFV23_07120 [Verrucomicrobiae bacterium]|nr:hypothetical protein [Verrucomicrobiae bacterium]
MRISTTLFLGLAALVCGCSSEHFVTGHGNVGQFILQQAILRGGNPATTNDLPIIDTKWRYSTDKYGVVIRMPREEYPSIEKFLFQAFGKPGFGPTDISNGGRLGEYRLTAKGGGIQFVSDTNWTQVTIIRPMSKQEWNTEVMPKAIKAMNKSQ